MNIFFLSKHTVACARYHNDKHCVKMILEYAQIMSTVHHKTNSCIDRSKIYKPTHINHPCVKWCQASQENYKWLYSLFVELCREYTFRYGKVHACETKLKTILSQVPDIPSLGMSNPPQAMPDDCRQPNTILAYKTYYKKHKNHIATWKHRGNPLWFTLAI